MSNDTQSVFQALNELGELFPDYRFAAVHKTDTRSTVELFARNSDDVIAPTAPAAPVTPAAPVPVANPLRMRREVFAALAPVEQSRFCRSGGKITDEPVTPAAQPVTMPRDQFARMSAKDQRDFQIMGGRVAN